MNFSLEKHFTNSINSSFSNVLPCFMSFAPNKVPLFQQIKVTNKEKLFINQIVEKCPICFKKKIFPSRPNNCIHVFCRKCLKKWIKISNKCPICRAKFNIIIKLL